MAEALYKSSHRPGSCWECGHDAEHHAGQQGEAPPACAMCEYEGRPQSEADHAFAGTFAARESLQEGR